MAPKLEIPGEIVKAVPGPAQMETTGQSIRKQCRCDDLKCNRCRITKACAPPDPTEYICRAGTSH